MKSALNLLYRITVAAVKIPRAFQTLLSIGLMFFALTCPAQSPIFNPTSAAFEKEGRMVTLQATGFSNFTFGFSAVVEVGETERSFSSIAGSVQSVTNSTESTPYGQAAVSISTIYFDAVHLESHAPSGKGSGCARRSRSSRHPQCRGNGGQSVKFDSRAVIPSRGWGRTGRRQGRGRACQLARHPVRRQLPTWVAGCCLHTQHAQQTTGGTGKRRFLPP